MSIVAISDAPSQSVRLCGFVAGPVLALIMLIIGAPEGMKPAAWGVSALACWMAIWWMTEAMPLAVTSLLPIIILPMFHLTTFEQAVAPFASSIIFLFLGGFILSAGMQKWNLHVRIVLSIVRIVGHSPRTILAGLMLATCFLAFWMSNTATAVMMMPMAISVATLLMPAGSSNTAFTKALVLGIAYASAIGGLGTFVGTPTNAMLQGFMAKTYGTEITLLQWMSFGMPIVLLLGAFAWALLTRIFLRHAHIAEDAHSRLENEFSKLGKMQQGEKLVAMVFLVCVALWIFGGYLESGIGISLSDAGIAIFGALLLFLIPLNFRNAEFVLTWKDAERLPWGILIFFGGSLSLSAAMTSTGVTAWLGAELSVFSGLSLWLIVLGVVLMIILVSELMSNVATIAAFLPILAGLADGMQVHPLMVLVPATLAASCGFMMPGASAANAIAFSTGYLRSGEMVRAGLWLNLAAALMITVICLLLLPLLV